MSDRTINFGESETEATYQIQDTDSSGGGNFVVAKDTNANTVLLEYDPATDTWEYAGDVDMNGGNVSGVGTLTAESVNTEEASIKGRDVDSIWSLADDPITDDIDEPTTVPVSDPNRLKIDIEGFSTGPLYARLENEAESSYETMSLDMTDATLNKDTDDKWEMYQSQGLAGEWVVSFARAGRVTIFGTGADPQSGGRVLLTGNYDEIGTWPPSGITFLPEDGDTAAGGEIRVFEEVRP